MKMSKINATANQAFDPTPRTARVNFPLAAAAYSVLMSQRKGNRRRQRHTSTRAVRVSESMAIDMIP